MKDILTRLFNHEELTSEETKQILLNITREAYPEAQISADRITHCISNA